MRLLLALLSALTVSASPLLVTANGSFSASTPTSAFSAPGESWSLSFGIAANPAVSNVSSGNGFDAAYSNFSYTINGSPVTASVADLRFFNSAISGLFSICFTTACPGNSVPQNAVVFEGAQAYSGPESAPLIMPGVYTPSLAGVVVNGDAVKFASNSAVTIAGQATPEPASLFLLSGGITILLLNGAYFRRKRSSEE